jgi:phosphatidylglycerol:prolipoprotein diacylglycerol transferase
LLPTGDVHPEWKLFVGDARVTVALHGLFIAVGFAAGSLLALGRGRGRLPVLATTSVVTVAALAASHGLFRLLHGDAATVWSGGLASTGGVVAGLVASTVVARLARRSVGEILDVIAPAGLLALAIGRVGCFLGGCCYGRATTLPWGVVFPELGPPARHPLQLYSAAGDALVLCAALVPGLPPGVAARRACVGLGVLRFGLEFFRDPGATDVFPGGWLTLAQAASLALVGWAIFGLRAPGPFDYGSAAEESAWPMTRP